MAAMNLDLQEDALVNFEAFMHRLSLCTSQSKLSISDVAKEITKEPFLSDLTQVVASGDSLEPWIDEFLEKCPFVAEAINFLLEHLSFDFLTSFDSMLEAGSSDGDVNGARLSRLVSGLAVPDDDVHCASSDHLNQALQFNILPMFTNYLSSNMGLKFLNTTISNIVSARYKFCRDLLLFQFMLNKCHYQLKSECMPKIMPIESLLIPRTVKLWFGLDYLLWTCTTPMITNSKFRFVRLFSV